MIAIWTSTMTNVAITRSIPEPGPGMLRVAGHGVRGGDEDRALTRDELHRLIVGCDGVLTQLHDAVDAAFFDAAGPQIRVVSQFAVGFNNIDVAEATRRGVAVCNTPGVLDEATADIAWTLLLGVTRRVIEGDRITRAGDFRGWGPNMLLGGDVVGRTLAIIGAGRIGHAVARRAMGWNMRIIYVARSDKPDWERDFGAMRMELDDALAAADFVSLHVPLTPGTHHMINADRLARMKPTAYLVNTARGPVVDEKALVEALRAGRIAGAGLDVYEEEPKIAAGLSELANVLLLPHLGSATRATRAAMSRLSASNLLAVLDGREPDACVNRDALGGG
jgi:glyoxylate reductase